MRFIAACVGFSVFVLLCLIFPNTDKGKELLGFDRQERRTIVYRVDKQMARIDIHDIIIFNTTPKTFAIAGELNDLGKRELLTSLDSIVETSNYLKWAKQISESFDWSETENPIYKHRGSYIPFYNLDSLFDQGIIHSIYHVEYTRSNVYYSTSYAEAIIFSLSLFFLSYFVFSFTIGWSAATKFKFVALFYCLGFLIFYTAIFFTNNSSFEGLRGKFIVFHLVHVLLFGVVILVHRYLKSINSSISVYQGVLYLAIVFSFPLAYFVFESLDLVFVRSRSVFNSFTIIHLRSISLYLMMGMGMGLADLAVFWRKNYRDIKETKKTVLQSQLRTVEQLNSLNARLNPHFLYNSLNAIAGLINSDPLKAEEMTLAISRFLKHFSNRKEEHVITVKEEVAVILDYISIEKIRFEEKLQFEYSADEDSLASNIPRSILQPLIENAVKYGYSKDTNVISVRLQIETKEDDLMIRIYDSGGRFDASLDKGYGISSVFNKLELLYKGQYSFEFVNEPEKHIEIIIPSQMSMADA